MIELVVILVIAQLGLGVFIAEFYQPLSEWYLADKKLNDRDETSGFDQLSFLLLWEYYLVKFYFLDNNSKQMTENK